MKKNKVILYALLLLLLPLGAAKAQGFDQVYSFSPYPSFSIFSSVRSILPDDDQFFVLGLSYKDTLILNNFSSLSTTLSSFDYNGNLNWQKNIHYPGSILYEATEPYFFHSLAKIQENKYVIGSIGWDTLNVPGYATSRPFLYLFNEQGDSLRFVSIPYGNDENINYLFALSIDQQKNIVVGGEFLNKIAFDTIGIWLSKFDSTGDFLWRKVIVNQEQVDLSASAYKIVAANDGLSYMIGGIAGTNDSSKSMFAFTKTDTAGNLIWQKNLPRATFQGHGYNWLGDQYFDIIPANNGTGYYFMAADLQPVYPPGEGPGFLPIYYCGKIDEEGEVVWAKTYKRDTTHREQCVGLKQKPNGDLVFLGKSVGNDLTSEGLSSLGTALFSTNSIGNVKWFRILRRYNCEYDVAQVMHTLSITQTGNIILGGYIGQFNGQPGCYDSTDAIAWLVLTDSMGRRDPSDTATFTLNADSVVYPADTTAILLVEDKDRPQLRLYPNPAGNKVYAELLNLPSGNGKAMLHLYDHLGRQLKQQVLQGSKTAVDISAYPAGLYYIRLRYRDKDVGGYKLVKE